MSLMDHVAILTHSALDVAKVNRLKDTKPLEYFAVLAFPPAAGAELQALCQQVAGGPLGAYEIGITTNAQKGQKQLPGIPGDWFVVRAATQYAPYVAGADGTQLEQGNPAHANIIRTAFYAGKKVRAALTAFTWNYKNTKQGISFNLQGIMDAGEESERMNIGVGVTANAFAAYGKPGAVTGNVAAMNANAETRPANNGNPFAAGGNAQPAAAPAAQSGNPFAQAAGSNNPFGQ